MRSLVVSNRGGGSVSIYAVEPYATAEGAGATGHATASKITAKEQLPRLRAVFTGCLGATDAVILDDSSKAFIACSGGHQVMAVSLAAAPESWAAKQNATLLTDHMLALMDVGQTPVQLALKPDGGEIFCANFGSDSISEIETGTNEVGGTYTIGSKPVYGVVSADNGTLWVSDFGGDSINLWSIDDGKLAGSVRTGHAPDALLRRRAPASGGGRALGRRLGGAHGQQEGRGNAVHDPTRGRLAQRHCGEGNAGQAMKNS